MPVEKESSKKVVAKRESSQSRRNVSTTRNEIRDAINTEAKPSRSKQEASKDNESSRNRASSSSRTKDKVKRQDSKTREPTEREKVTKVPSEASRVKRDVVIKDGVKLTSTSTRSSSKGHASGDQLTPSRGAVPKQVVASRDSKKISSESRKTSHSVVVHSPNHGEKQSVYSSSWNSLESHSRSREVNEYSRIKEDRVTSRSRRPKEDVKERDKTISKQSKVTGEIESRRRTAETIDKTKKLTTHEDKPHHRSRRVGEVVQERKPSKDISKKEKVVIESAEAESTKGRTRNITRVLSPSEVKIARGKILDADDVPEKRESKDVERFPIPVASTSRHQESANQEDEDDEEVDYEDDFEDYESDFEEDTDDDASDQERSVVPELMSRHAMPSHGDEEKKLDSGHYDMGESQRKSKHLQEIRAAIERENSAVIRKAASTNKEAILPVDEGFEEEKTEDVKKTSFARPKTSFINFAHARKRQMEQKVNAMARKRGVELLNMITLDVMKYKIFELAPVSYDLYMKSYGRTGTAQAQVQTNDENLAEEVQTDEIRTKEAWTQKPAAFEARGRGVVATTLEQDRLGVGREASPPRVRPRSDPASLDSFLSRVGPMMLVAIQEGGVRGELTRNPADIGFSKGFIALGVAALPFLAGRAVKMMRYPACQPDTLLTVHASAGETSELTDARLRRSVMCVWSVTTPDAPQHVLAAWHDVTAACFDADRATLVLAGLSDGAVCCWDLREATTSHEQVNDVGVTCLLRSPSYNTAEVLKGEGHCGPVLSLQPLIDKETSNHGEYSPSQVCSLEESGTVIVWTVIQSAESGMKSGVADQDLGMAYWGRVRLVKSATISLEDNLQMDPILLSNLLFADLHTNVDDCNHLYVTTNTGHVVHGLKSGAKPTPRLYQTRSDGLTFAKCIETFPFGHSLFLVGSGDGSVHLYRRETENPLTTLAGTGDAPGQGPTVLDIQWSRSRPTIFFVLDETSRIHVWDLGQSDMYPRFTATLSDADVTAIQLAPDLRDAKTTPQMAISTVNGTVEIHHLKDDYRYKSNAEMNRELNNFIRFTNIL